MNLLSERTAAGTLTAGYAHGYTPIDGIGSLTGAKKADASTDHKNSRAACSDISSGVRAAAARKGNAAVSWHGVLTALFVRGVVVVLRCVLALQLKPDAADAVRTALPEGESRRLALQCGVHLPATPEGGL